MTTIVTDNPLIKYWLVWYDIVYKYWYIILILVVIYFVLRILKMKN